MFGYVDVRDGKMEKHWLEDKRRGDHTGNQIQVPRLPLFYYLSSKERKAQPPQSLPLYENYALSPGSIRRSDRGIFSIWLTIEMHAGIWLGSLSLVHTRIIDASAKLRRKVAAGCGCILTASAHLVYRLHFCLLCIYLAPPTSR